MNDITTYRTIYVLLVSQEILSQARRDTSGLKLEVNQRSVCQLESIFFILF